MKSKKIIKSPFLSIIIPIFNEEKRLINLLSIFNYLKHKKFLSEVILVNDGSTDKSSKVARNISNKLNSKNIFKLISYSMNKGKGYAIKKGMLKATGQYHLFTDIDLSTPIEEFDKFLMHINKFEILIGSRKKKGAKLLKHQPQVREKLGKGFTKIAQMSLGLNFSDFTCGFKCFSKNATLEIFKRQKISRWGFDPEILFIAKKLGFKIKEIPVTWRNDSETKVRLPHDIISSLADLVKIRYYDLKKLYG